MTPVVVLVIVALLVGHAFFSGLSSRFPLISVRPPSHRYGD